MAEREAGPGRTQAEEIGDVRRAYAGKLFPDLQVSTFRNIDRLFPTRTVKRGEKVLELPQHHRQLEDFPIPANGTVYDIYDYVSRNRVTGLLILKDGRIAMEYYGAGNDRATRWMSMSVAKSISSTLVGAAIRDGYIGGLEDQLTRYLPELEGSGYDGVTVRELLQMTSGVHWDETHTNPNSERSAVLELQIGQQPGAIMRYMASLPRVAAPGTRWNYSTGETHVVGALLHAATGRWVSDYLTDKIWSKLGMERDASWWLESPDGLEVAGSGISATLRDYARFGLFIMNDGIIDGERVLPEGWVREAGSPRMIGGAQVDYGFMWWPVKGPDGSYEGFAARGIFGQFIYVNPRARVVVAVWSARAKPRFAEVILDNDFFNAVVEALA
ncbi:MAG TPA: serine hydrolase [Sphingomonadales bacterium]